MNGTNPSFWNMLHHQNSFFLTNWKQVIGGRQMAQGAHSYPWPPQHMMSQAATDYPLQTLTLWNGDFTPKKITRQKRRAFGSISSSVENPLTRSDKLLTGHVPSTDFPEQKCKLKGHYSPSSYIEICWRTVKMTLQQVLFCRCRRYFCWCKSVFCEMSWCST